MTVRKVDVPKVPVTTAPTQTEKAPAAQNTVKTPAPAASSTFDTTAARPSELARASRATAHVPLPSIAPGERPSAPGPVSVDSREGQAALQKSFDFINGRGTSGRGFAGPSAAETFAPRSIERDELGMMHVRLDRTHEGVKVFGEQVITHLDAEGKVSSMTGETAPLNKGLGSDPTKLSEKQALAIAQKEFAGKTDRAPTVERVVFQDKNGEYKAAFRVELTNTTSADAPKRMNYMVDANSGKVLDQWNQMGGIELDRAPANTNAEPVTVTASTSPNAAIADKSTTTTTLDVADDVSIEKLKLDLDIPHTYKGDLVVTLTSPSGKSAVVHNRTGGSADNVKGSFDLSQFAGESSKGQWKLTVEDKAARDVGTVKTWGLTITGTKAAPPPPPPPPPTGKGDDVSLYSGTVDLSTKKGADGKYTLDDSTRGGGVVTVDAQNKSRPSNPVAFTDDNNIWGEAGDNPRNKAAVDAHYGAQMTYDFMKDVLGRDSIDGKGEKLVSNVHINNNYVNAFWDGKQMNYGDGDGKQAGPLTTLDIAGHEIAHGLTERTAGLIYRNESGGLNEAMSDIIGTGVEWYAAQKNPNVKFDWSMGEDAWTPNNGDPNDALRYMNDPTKDKYSIDHYSNYPKQTEVHGSSGIANNAFYLLVEGGTNKTSKMTVDGGIGMEKGQKIFYRALAHYMTPSTTFAQARTATVQAATDLYGANSVEVQKVKDSWAAVGVN